MCSDSEVEVDVDAPWLDPVGVGKAKALEIANLKSFNVFQVVPRGVADGKKHITTRWEVSYKEDQGLIRARFVAREFKRFGKRYDVFAAATEQTTSRLIDFVGLQLYLCFLTFDFSTAFLNAPETEECYVDPPVEWVEEERQAGTIGRDEEVVWRLLKQLYGRRRAAAAFVDWLAELLISLAFERHPGHPQFFIHRDRQLYLEVHMDDGQGCGPPVCIKEFAKELSDATAVKFFGPIEHGQEYSHLKRFRTPLRDGTVFRGNPRYLRGVQHVLGMEGCASAPTPSATGTKPKPDDGDALPDARLFRSCAGSLLYAANDRGDIGFEVNEITGARQTPTVGDLRLVTRVVRYLAGTQDIRRVWRRSLRPEEQGFNVVLNGYSDADWGKAVNGKSKSSSFIRDDTERSRRSSG